MAPGLTEQILLQIQAAVSGQQQITGLTNSLGGLSAATQQVNGRFLDSAGRLREANGQFVALGGAARAAQGGLLGAASGAQGLNLGLLNLNAGLQIVQQVTAAVQGLVGQMKEWADASNKATTDTRVFELTLARFGVRVDEANGAAERLAVKFGLSVEEVKGAMTNLIRVGFRDMGQLEQLMTGAAASSLAFGRTAAEGFDRIGDAAVTGLSAALNSIGIAENLGPAYDKAAKALGKTADDLNEAEKATVLYNLVTKATTTEVEALGEIQNDYVRSQQAASLAQKDFAKAMGELTIPVMIRLNRAGADVVGTVVEMVKAYQGGGDAAAKFAREHPAIADAMQRIAPVARQMQTSVSGAFSAIQTTVNQTLIPVMRAIQPVVQQVWTQVPGLIESAGHVIEETFRLIDALWKNVLKPVWDVIGPTVQQTVGLVVSLLRGMFELISGIFKAVGKLVEGDWRGAMNVMTGAADKVGEIVGRAMAKVWQALVDLVPKAKTAATNIGNAIRDGFLSGVNQLEIMLAESVGKAMKNMLGYIPDWAQRLLGISQSGESAQQYGNPELGNLGNLKDMTAGLGISGFAQSQGFGENKNRLGYGAAGHNGVDFATPTGTKLYAPFAGQVMVQQDKWLGRMVTLVDAEGRKLVLGHLSEFNAELVKTIQAAGHSVAIARGTFLGKTGGALSDPLRGNSTGAHLHLGMYDARGRLQNPERYGVGVPYGPGAQPTPVVPTPTTTPAAPKPLPSTPTPPPAAATDGPISSAQIARAQALLAALDKAKKALEADPKNTGLIKAFDEADRAVKSWTKGNDSNARALAAVQAGMGGVSKAAGTYVATQADLTKYGTQALLLIKEQEAAAKSGSSAEIERVRRKVTTFTEAGRAQAAVFAAEGAAYQARQAAADKADASEKEVQQARAQAAQQLAALGATQLQQRVAGEEAAGQAIERLRERRLDQTQNDLDLSLQVEQNYARRSLAQARETAQAQLVLAKRTAEQAYKDSVASIPEKASAAQRKALTDAAAAVRDGAVSAAYREHYESVSAVAEQGAQRVRAAEQAIKAALQDGFDTADRLAGQMGPGMESRRDVPEQISLQTIIANLPRAQSEVAGFEKALRELNAEGKVSAKDLETALLLIPRFGDGVARLGDEFAEVEGRLDAQAKRFDDLNGQYERGEITADAYRDSMRTLAGSYDLQAQAAERANKPALVDFFRAAQAAAQDAADSVHTLNDELAKIASQGQLAVWLASNAGDVPAPTQVASTDGDGNTSFGDLGGFDQAMTDAFSGSTADQIAQAIALTTSEVWQDAGQTAREEFWTRFADLKAAPDFQAAIQGFSADTLYGLSRAMGSDENWADLRAVIDERFRTLLTRVDVSDPGALEDALGGITQAVDEASEKYETGQISAEEYNGTLLAQADALAALLTRLRAMGPEFAAAADSVALLLGSTLGLTQGLKDLDVPLSAGEAQLADMVVSLLPLEKGLRDGTMTLGEFTAAALEVIPKIEALARAAMVAGNPELAGQYRQLANELRGMGGPTLKVAEGLGKFQQYAGYAQQLAGSFGQLAGAFGNDDLAANLQGIANLAGKAISLAGDVAKILANPADIGAWVSAITTVVSSIAEAMNGHRKAYEEAKKAREEYQKGFSIINTDAFASFTVRSRGWLADTFGGGPEVMRVVNEFAANIARTIEQGVKNGFSNGIKSFLSGTGDLLSGIREGVRGAIIDAVTQALIEGAILKGQLGGLLTSLTTTLAAGQDPSGIIAAIAQALPGVAASLTQVLTPIRSAIDQAFPRDMGSAGGSFSGGGGGTFQAGTPQVVIDVLGETRTLLKGANEVMTVMADAARLQYRAGELMYAAAERMYGPHNTGTVGGR